MNWAELRETYIYHAIKPILFGAFFAAFFSAGLTCALRVNWDAPAAIVLLAIAAAAMIALLAALTMLGMVVRYSASYRDYYDGVCAAEDYCIVVEGAQGSGKTDTIKREAIIKAEHQYRQLLDEYRLLYHRLPDIIRRQDARELEQWGECSKVVKFYHAHPEIFPCLFSNVPMTVDGREVMQFQFALLVQEANLGYRSVVIIDEARDSGVTSADSRNLPQDMDEVFRFVRQFYNGFIYCSEQNKARISLSLRCVAVNYTMLRMDKGILRPRVLIRYYNRRYNKFAEKYGVHTFRLWAKNGMSMRYDFNFINMARYALPQLRRFRRAAVDKTALALRAMFVTDGAEASKLLKLKILCDNIGFIRYKRKLRGGTEGNIEIDTSDKVIYRYYMPAKRRYDSDTRMFRGINKARKLPFAPVTWGTDRVVTREYWDKNLEYRKRYNKKIAAEMAKNEPEKGKEQQ